MKYWLITLSLIILGLFVLAGYVFGMVIAPWIVSALIAAAIPYSLALIITWLPLLTFSAPLFALCCVALKKHVARNNVSHKDLLSHYGENREGYFKPFSIFLSSI